MLTIRDLKKSVGGRTLSLGLAPAQKLTVQVVTSDGTPVAGAVVTPWETLSDHDL